MKSLYYSKEKLHCCISGEKMFSYEIMIVLPYQELCLQDLRDKMNTESNLNLNETNRGVRWALLSLLSYAWSSGSLLYFSLWFWWPARSSECSSHVLVCPLAILFLSIGGSGSSQKDVGNVHICALTVSSWLCQNAAEPSSFIKHYELPSYLMSWR